MFVRLLLLVIPLALLTPACAACTGPGVELPADGGPDADGDGGGGDPDGGDTSDAGADAGSAGADELVPYFGYESIDGGTAPNGTKNIWLRKADGTSPLAVTRLANASSTFPFFNSTRTRLVYISDQLTEEPHSDASGLQENVWSYGPEGTTPVTKFTAASAAYARWTHDDRIVFGGSVALDGGDAAGPTNLWIMNDDGSSLTPVTSQGWSHVLDRHTFAVDQNSVYYASERPLESGEEVGGLTFNIWKAPLAGGAPVSLTQNLRATSNFPTPSPDGAQVAFLSERPTDMDVDESRGFFNVWLMGSDGSTPRPLTTFSSATVEGPLQWADDGASLIFMSNCDSTGVDDPVDGLNVFNLFKVDVASGAITALTFHAGAYSSHPVRLDRSAHVVFNSNRSLDGGPGLGTAGNLLVVGTDGTGLAPVTSSENAHSYTAVTVY